MTRPVLGAVQVRVHGLADRVRVGVLLRVPRRLRPCEHAAQVPAFRPDDSGLPRLQFIDRVGHCSFATVTGIPPCATVQKTGAISFVQFFGRLMSSVAVQRQVPWFDSATSWRCRQCSTSTVVDIPVVAQRQDWGCKLHENR